MNSVQQFTTSPQASLVTRTLGTVSLIIWLMVHYSTKIFQRLLSTCDPRSAKRVQKMRGEWWGAAGSWGWGTPTCVRDLGWDWEGGGVLEITGTALPNVREEKAKVVWKFEHWGATFESPQRSGRCRLTSPQPCQRRGKIQGHWPCCGTLQTPGRLGSKEWSPTCCQRLCLYHWCF